MNHGRIQARGSSKPMLEDVVGEEEHTFISCACRERRKQTRRVGKGIDGAVAQESRS